MLAQTSTAKYQNWGETLGNPSFVGLQWQFHMAQQTRAHMAWQAHYNKFCYHGDHFKQTRLSTGETQARMDRERGSVCLWICEDVGELLENTAGSKVSAVLMYVNWFNIINMVLIAEKKKKNLL